MGYKTWAVWKMSSVETLLFLVTTQLLIIDQSQSFDLASTLLSQGSNFPLEKLRSLISPETIQKFLQSKGLASSVETLRGGDRNEIQKLLSRLKPMQGRIDPHIMELLTSSLMGSNEVLRPPPPSPPRFHPPPRPKFSSKFKRRRPGRGRAPSLTSLPPPPNPTKVYENPDGTLQFDQIDPNIRNHKLYGWRNQNFTTIDRNEDLMMDESESQPPALIPLSPEESNEDGTSSTKPGHWTPNPTAASGSTEESPVGSQFTREPLRKGSDESHPISAHFGPTASTPPHFRPSPLDNQSPLRVFNPPPTTRRESFSPADLKKRQDYASYLQRVGQTESQSQNSANHPPYSPRRPQYNPNVKQDRILSLGNQEDAPAGPPGPPHPLPIPTHGFHPQRIRGQESQLNYQYAKPAHYPGKSYRGQPHHPFSHYNERNEMYSPSHYHHNKFHYLNPSIEVEPSDQSPASDKVDGFWSSSTFLILGGIVAASAVAAFVLPTLLPAAAAAGKESEASATTEANTDFWNEVKGLYSDLTHLAKGDLTHFEPVKKGVQNKSGSSASDEDPEEKQQPIRREDEEVIENSSEEPEVIKKRQHQAHNRRGTGRIGDGSLATPLPHQLSTGGDSGSRSSYFGSPNNSSSVMKEWVKLQLKVIE